MRMTRGELAKRCGINPETIRYYERSGILPPAPRSNSGYRLFDDSAVWRISFVKRAQAAGLTLDEIKTLLHIQLDPTSTCGDVRGVVEAKIGEIDTRIQALHAMRDLLAALVLDCPGGARPLDECPILDTFEGQPTLSLSMNRGES
jgi:DNA-binding transcriptional MerR regulator